MEEATETLEEMKRREARARKATDDLGDLLRQKERMVDSKETIARYRECRRNPTIQFKTDENTCVRALYYKLTNDRDAKNDVDEYIRINYYRRRMVDITMEFDLDFMLDESQHVRNMCFDEINFIYKQAIR